jgi:hypothetical protein
MSQSIAIQLIDIVVWSHMVADVTALGIDKTVAKTGLVQAGGK